MLDNNKDLTISGGTLTDNRIFNTSTYAYIGAKGGFDRLEEQVAHRAFHNSGERFDAPKCHPCTRVAVLERIMEWIWGREDRDALILWLYGPAGAGKSSIAQSIAEKCDELGILLATFFFSKSDGSRNSSHSLIPTLAYQVALLIPETRERISAAILHDPLVFTKSLRTQIELLLIEPLRPLIYSGYFSGLNSRRLIIIDGLDECQDPNVQQNIVEQISHVLKARDVPLIFLVASRPEVHLSVTFNLPLQASILTRLTLDEHHKPEEDIRVYLEDAFKQIRSTHPRKDFFPTSWASPDQVKTLIDKSSGQFIYAATVVKYVGCLRHSPVDRLDVILGLHPPQNDRPFVELDALYKEIFLALEDPRSAVHILGVGNILFPYVEVAANVLLLNPSDACGHMSNIGALVALKTHVFRSGKLTAIEVHHKSLMEFLEDPSRAGRFYLDLKIVHAQIARRYLQLTQDERGFNLVSEMWRNLPPHLLHLAPGKLVQHCRSASMTEELREDLTHLSVPKFIDFFLRHPLYGSLDGACEVLETLMNLTCEEFDIPEHEPALRKHLLNLLEPYISYPRLTSSWILAVDPWNMCRSHTSIVGGTSLSELLQLDEPLRAMDKTGFWFTRGSLEWARSNCQHLKSVMPSTIAECRGAILATLVLHLLEYLCQQKLPSDTRLRKTNYDLHMIRNTPWRWRQRSMATKPSWSKLDRDEARGGGGAPKCFQRLYRYRNRSHRVYRQESLSNLIYALDRLPRLLKQADRNDDLITFASQHAICPQQAFHFPQLRKRARKAINAYLAKFPTNPLAIPLPEYFGEEPSSERLEHKPSTPLRRIFDLFPHFLAFLAHIYFLWITCFV